MRVISKSVKNASVLDIKRNEREGIYNWGIDNQHPQLIDKLLQMSVTSKNCVNLVAKAIYGKSFGPKYNSVILNERGQNLNDILRIASREYAKYSNVFFLINYNLQYKVVSIEVIPSSKVRVGKTDSGGYTGTYIVSKDWSDRKEPTKEYFSYNPLKTVIQKQIESQGIKKFSGQILHIQEDSNSIYSESSINTVMREAVIQYNSQEFRLNGSEEGFLNTKIMVTQPFDSEESKRRFLDTLKNNRGSRNSGGVIVLETAQVSDDLEKELHLEDLTSPYNDKLFEYSDSQAKRNISEAFGVPSILVGDQGESVFANSGELLKSAREMLWESKEEERQLITSTLIMLVNNFEGLDIDEVELEVIKI